MAFLRKHRALTVSVVVTAIACLGGYALFGPNVSAAPKNQLKKGVPHTITKMAEELADLRAEHDELVRIVGELSAALNECCDGSGGGADCADRCDEAAEALRAECLAAGMSEEECDAAAQVFLEECLTACDEPPPPPSCADRCDSAVQAFLRECRDAGLSEEECIREAAAFRQQCLSECENSL